MPYTPMVAPKLSSQNPYRLLKVSDHFGTKAKILNPEVRDEELRAVTVKDVYWKDALPASIQASMKNGDPTNADFYIGIQEYIPRYTTQMNDFAARAGHQFVLASPGHPDLTAMLSGMKLSNGALYQMFGVRIDNGSRRDLVPGATYTIRPQNTNDTYTWTVKSGLELHAGHGLNYLNVAGVATLDGMAELNIGHSIVSRALFVGMTQAVREMKECIRTAKLYPLPFPAEQL